MIRWPKNPILGKESCNELKNVFSAWLEIPVPAVVTSGQSILPMVPKNFKVEFSAVFNHTVTGFVKC